MRRPRIYLAGPEVFLPNAAAVGAAKCRLCAAAGLEGVFPLDAALDLSGLLRREQARLISESNEGLMRTCDAAVANLTPFRGVSADAGTAYEVGFMRALGRPVLGYSNTPLTYLARSRLHRAAPRLAFDCDGAAIEIEDFDGAENLMIEIAIEASGSRLVTHAAQVGEEMTDLAAFRICLDEAVRVLGATG